MDNYFISLFSSAFEDYISLIRAILDIAFVSYCVYRILLVLKGTRAVQLIRGLVLLFVLYIFVSHILQLKTMTWIMQNAATLIVFAIPIVFQPELRRMLAHLGKDRSLSENLFSKGKDLFDFINIIVLSVKNLSNKKTGALIVIERGTGLNEFIETGISIDAELSPEIIETIFYSGTPLHDGAIVIRNSRLTAGSVLLPLSENIKPVSGKHNLGTRHRAGLGISETSDAFCIIVSEETGDITVALQGKLHRYLSEETLEKLLLDTLQTKEKNQLSLKPENIKNNIKNLGDKITAKNEEATENKQSFWEKIKSGNLNLKLMSVVAGIVFMVFLGKEISFNSHEKTYVLPLDIKYSEELNQKAKFEVKPSFIKIRVSGTQQNIDSITPEDLNVYVNINKIEDNQRVSISVLAPSSVTIKEVSPKEVLVNTVK